MTRSFSWWPSRKSRASERRAVRMLQSDGQPEVWILESYNDGTWQPQGVARSRREKQQFLSPRRWSLRG